MRCRASGGIQSVESLALRIDGMAHQPVHLDLVILDELGYLPFSQPAGDLPGVLRTT